MRMTPAIDITAEQRRTVLALLDRHLPDTAAWACGSRVKGTSRPTSDLDLVVFAGPEQSDQVAELREAFGESNLPFRVDLFVWDGMPESSKRRIKAKYAVLVEREGQGTDGEQLFGLLPDDWEYTTLGVACNRGGGDIQTGPFGSQLHASDYVDVGIPSIMPQNIGDNRINVEGIARIGSDDASRLNRYLVQEGDIVYSRRGDVERRALVRSAEDGWLCGTGCLRVRLGENGVDPRYASYLLGHPSIREWIVRHAHGATMPNLNTSILSACPFIIPPNAEQRAIAYILGTLDDKIELNRRMNETLEAMARALFNSWFVDFDPVRAKMEGRDTGLPKPIADLFPDRMSESELGLIPDGWEILPLPKLIEINPRRSLRKGEIAPYLDMANMPTKGHVPHAVVDRQFGSGMRFINGDTLVARITPCLENGKTAYVDFLQHDEIGWGSTEYIVMRPMPPLPDEFAYYLARSTRFREFAIQNMTGTSGRQRVPAAALSQFVLPAPPKPIAESFGKFVRPLAKRMNETETESRILTALRDTLLPKLISGEIRLQNAERQVEGVT